jgi:hypothetical protein
VPAPLKESPTALYNLTNDYSENNDLAAKQPGKLQDMQEQFLIEATKDLCCRLSGTC